VPSSRALAADLGVSRIVCVTAYQQLVAEGLLAGRVGAGTFVSDAALQLRPAATAAPPAGRPGPRRLPRERLLPEAQPWLACWGPFRLGQTAVAEFPAELWSRLLVRCIRRQPRRQMSYGDPMGHAPLREAIADHLRAARSVRCAPDQIMIVSGSQQALALAARALLAPGDEMWFEDPGYPGARDAFALAGARPIPVPVDDDGLDVAAGLARCPRARAAYVTPSHQYPLGAVLTHARRLALLAWARRRGAWIIEDDYDTGYDDGSPIPSLHGLDGDRRVIHIGTFSKAMFPALRLGYLVIPADLVERFTIIRATLDNFPGPLLQRALDQFLREGHFARHLRRMRTLYAERRRVLVHALERDLGLRVRGHRAGMHVVAMLPRGVSDRAVAIRAAQRGLSVTPLSSCYATPRPASGLVLGFGGTPAGELVDAVRVLGRELAR
jgi:GntR family transcriptional regulator/MocR family aminotransferase